MLPQSSPRRSGARSSPGESSPHPGRALLRAEPVEARRADSIRSSEYLCQWDSTRAWNILRGHFHTRRFESEELTLLLGSEKNVTPLLPPSRAVMNPAEVDAADRFDTGHETKHDGDVSRDENPRPRIRCVARVISDRCLHIGKIDLHLGWNRHPVQLFFPVARRDQIVHEHQKANVERLPPSDDYLPMDQSVIDPVQQYCHQWRSRTTSDARPRSAAPRAASAGEAAELHTKSRSVARLTPLTRTSSGLSRATRRAAIVALPAGKSVKMTLTPSDRCDLRAVSMSLGAIPVLERQTN